MWILAYLSLFVAQSAVAVKQCDRNIGPPGHTECIQLPRYYNQYQWGTCLSDAYIKQKSGHKHYCLDRTATYCWYQCMLEVHNKEYGSVVDDCSCNSSSPSTVSPTTSLPPECYSPSGDSCDWYRNCLEKKYPCEATSNAYSIRYAEKFCSLFEKRRATFNADGQKWMDGVRKCLQVALVPLLRPWANPTCKEIREKAFASHTPCYLKPDKDVPSVCDLDYFQYVQIFWTIKGSFFKLDTAWESLKGLLDIGRLCTWSKIEEYAKFVKEKLDGVIKFFELKYEKLKQRKRRSTDLLPEADVQSRFADKVGTAIASALKWNTDVMDWLAYYDNQSIVIVLADKKALGIVNTSNPSVNFDQTIHEFASAIEKGTIPVQVDGNKIWIKSLASCSEKSCDNTQTLAVSKKPPWNGASRISHGTVGLCGVIASWIMLMYKPLF